MPLLRFRYFPILLVGLSPFVMPSVQAQVVIRERVEVHPDSAAGADRAPVPTASLSSGGPIRGYYVYYPGNGAGAPYAVSLGNDSALTGEVRVTTSTGAVFTGDIASGFTPDGITQTYGCSSGTYTKRVHTLHANIALVRVPVVEGETIASASVEVVGQTFPFVSSFSPGSVGCNLGVSYSVRCNCFASWPSEMKTASFSIWRAFEPPPPPDRLFVEAAPDSLALGEAATLTVAAVDSLGSEVALDGQTAVTLSVPSNPWGELVYGAARGTEVTAPYSDARAGAVQFVTDTTGTAPFCDATIAVTVTGGGLSGAANVVIRGSGIGAPDTLIVSASPSVLELGDSATVSAVALTEDGCEAANALPDSTRMLVAVSSTDQGSLEYGGARAAAFAGVPYGDLRTGQVQFVADSLACDSARVAISVFAGEDLWGETEIEVRTPENGRTICEVPLPEHDPATKEEVEQLIRATCPGSLPVDLGPYFQASVRATLNAAVQGTLGLSYNLPPAPTALPVDGWLNDLRDATTWQIVPGYVTSILEVKFNELSNDPFSGPQYRSHMSDLARAYSVPGTILSGAPLYVIATNSQDSRIGWLGSEYRTSNLTSEAAARRINVMHLRVTRNGSNFYLSGDLIGPKADVQSWIWDLLNDVEHPFVVSCTPED